MGVPSRASVVVGMSGTYRREGFHGRERTIIELNDRAADLGLVARERPCHRHDARRGGDAEAWSAQDRSLSHTHGDAIFDELHGVVDRRTGAPLREEEFVAH